MENAIKEIGMKFAQATIDLAMANSTIQDLQNQVSQLQTELNKTQEETGNENVNN